MAQQEHPGDLIIDTGHTVEQIIDRLLTAPAHALDAHGQHVVQVLIQGVHTGGIVTDSDDLTHNIGVLFFEEIVGAIVTDIAERRSATLNGDTVCIEDILADHSQQRNAVNRLLQIHIDHRAVSSAQMVTAILLIEDQRIGISSGSHIKIGQHSTGGQSEVLDLQLRLVNRPGFIGDIPGGITDASNIQNGLGGAINGVNTDDINTGAGGTGADHAGGNRNGQNIVLHIANVGRLDKMRRAIIANNSGAAGGGELISTGLGGCEQEVSTVSRIQTDINTANARIDCFVAQMLTGCYGVGIDCGRILAGQISHGDSQLGLVGGQLGSCRVIVALAVAGGIDLDSVVALREGLLHHTIGIDGSHGDGCAILHELDDDLFSVRIAQAIDDSDLISCVSGLSRLLTTGRQHCGTQHQQTQQQRRDTLCDLHKYPPIFVSLSEIRRSPSEA